MGKVHTATGLNEIRDAIKTLYDDVVVGDGDVEPTENDTALDNQVVSKAATVEDGNSGEFVVTATVPAGEYYANPLTEFGVKNAAGDLLLRVTHGPKPKAASDADIELRYRIRVRVRNPQS